MLTFYSYKEDEEKPSKKLEKNKNCAWFCAELLQRQFFFSANASIKKKLPNGFCFCQHENSSSRFLIYFVSLIAFKPNTVFINKSL